MATVVEDLANEQPMARLLKGEVGSGKTAVAVGAMLRAVEDGAPGRDDGADRDAGRTALRDTRGADAERAVLGRLAHWLAPVAVGPAARQLARGRAEALVGTHALIQEAVAFARLGVAVVDEQHRFGVIQRARSSARRRTDHAPHVLHMTATPIPRTLALTAFGDLDVTVITAAPGRQPIDDPRRRAERAPAPTVHARAGPRAPGVRRLPADRGVRGAQARAATKEYERLAPDSRVATRAPARAHDAAREAEATSAFGAATRTSSSPRL